MSLSPEQQLSSLRKRIDTIDDQLIALLRERIGVVEQVATLKAAHWPAACHIRPGREGRMHQRIVQAFRGSRFPAAAALAIWRQIIGASTHVESPLRIATTSALHTALATPYFGVTAEVTQHPSLAEALVAVQAGRCTILFAEAHDLPVVRAVAPKLHIFARLPLVDDGSPSVLALAEITPEDSGDDISYSLRDGRVTAIDGFTPAEGWLGAHPRPIRLEDLA